MVFKQQCLFKSFNKGFGGKCFVFKNFVICIEEVDVDVFCSLVFVKFQFIVGFFFFYENFV